MMSLTADFRYAARVLRKSPGFLVSAVLITALGIGANTATFSVVNAVLLRPLPFEDSGKIVTIQHVPPARAFPGIKTFSVSPANYLDWKKESDVFEAMSALGGSAVNLKTPDRVESLLAATTDPEFFSILRAKPELGRVYTAAENRPGRDVVVISHRYWISHFGGSKDAIGQKLILNNQSCTVIGVMRESFYLPSWFPASTQLWLPIGWSDADKAVRGNHNFNVVARLKPGVTVAQAQAQMNLISSRLEKLYPEDDLEWGAVVNPLREDLVGNSRPALLVLLGAVSFVLLIACANVTNLVLSRMLQRRKEVAIRSALGASRGRATREILAETLIVSLAGGAFGLILAHYGIKLIVATLAKQLPRSTEIGLDGSVLLFTFLLAVLTGIAAGLAASWRLANMDLSESLKVGMSKTDSYSGSSKTRGALVVAEVALSLVLLIGAGLMVRTLNSLRNTNPGFDASNVATMRIVVTPKGDAMQRPTLFDNALEAIRRVPGVQAAGGIDTLPLNGGGSQQPIQIEGRPPEVFAVQPEVAVRRATSNYFETMRIPLLYGRTFTLQDSEGKLPAIVISEAFAKQFWPNENPIGKKMRLSFTKEILREVVGVVGDVRANGLNITTPAPMLYMPFASVPSSQLTVVVRSSAGTPVLPEIRKQLAAIYSDATIRNVLAMEEIVANSMSQQRFSMFLFAAFAVLATVLAAIGIYSVLSFGVGQRITEIGVRLALGALPGDIIRLVVSDGMRPTILGLGAGVLISLFLSEALAKLVYGVSTTDPLTIFTVAALLSVVALAACVIPAWRATRVSPLEALRQG